MMAAAAATANSQGDLNIISIDTSTFSIEQGKTASSTFRIENTGNQTLTTAFTTTGVPDDTTINFNVPTIDIGPTEEKVITFTLRPTSSQAAGTYTPKIVASSGSNNSDEFELDLTITETSSKLRISDVTIDGTTLSDGETLQGVGPGDFLTLEFELINENDDIEIEDIDLEIVIEDIENQGRQDIEFNPARFRIQGGASENFNNDFKFRIPYDVDDQTEYEISISASGRDESGNRDQHNVRFETGLFIEKERDDVRFARLDIKPDELACGEDITFDVLVANYGSNDLDDAGYSIRSQELDINIRERFDLDDSPNSRSFSYAEMHTVTVGDLVEAGQYRIIVKTYHDGSQESDEDVRFVDITSCDTQVLNDRDEEDNDKQNSDNNSNENNANNNNNNQQELTDNSNIEQNNNNDNDSTTDNMKDNVTSTNNSTNTDDLSGNNGDNIVTIMIVVLIILLALSIIAGAYYLLML